MAYDIILGRDESDKKKFGEKGLIFIGKGYVKMGQYTSLSNRIFMDVARSHVVLVAGKEEAEKVTHLVLSQRNFQVCRQMSARILRH